MNRRAVLLNLCLLATVFGPLRASAQTHLRVCTETLLGVSLTNTRVTLALRDNPSVGNVGVKVPITALATTDVAGCCIFSNVTPALTYQVTINTFPPFSFLSTPGPNEGVADVRQTTSTPTIRMGSDTVAYTADAANRRFSVRMAAGTNTIVSPATNDAGLVTYTVSALTVGTNVVDTNAISIVAQTAATNAVNTALSNQQSIILRGTAPGIVGLGDATGTNYAILSAQSNITPYVIYMPTNISAGYWKLTTSGTNAWVSFDTPAGSGSTGATYTAGSGITISDNVISLYVAPSVSLANDQGNLEQGATAGPTILTWTVGGSITNQSLNLGVGTIPVALRRWTNSDSFTTNRTYLITVTDGVNPASSGSAVGFYQKRYWGASANTSLNDAQIIALSSELATSRLQTRSIATTASYLYFAWPASFGTATFVVDGFADEGWTLTTRSFVNASGYSESYHIYRHTLSTTGTYAVTVQ